MYSSQIQIAILGQVMHHDAVAGAIHALAEGLQTQAPPGTRVIWSPGALQTAMEDMQGAQHVFLVDPVLEGGGQLIFFSSTALSSDQKYELDRFLAMAERWMHALFEMEQLEATLGYAASQDPLTSILNARAYAARVAQLVQLGADHGSSVLVLHLDLIRFKSVNDQLGDDMGDELLFAFADRIRKQLGPDDCFGRLGPDEFGVCFVDRPDNQASAGFLQRFLRWVQKAPIQTSLWHGVRVGAAYGSVLQGHAPLAKEVLLAAANALRSTKVLTVPAFALAGQSPQIIESDLA